MKRKFLHKLLAAGLLAVILFTNTVFAAAEPTLSAPSAILVDAARGQVLFQENASTKLHVSTASKVMTLLLAIEKAKLDAKVTISKESTETEGSLVSLEVGEKYAVEDLLYAIMLASANDAANALAESIAGDTAKFVEMMNEKAKTLGLKDTHFTNPTGLFQEGQYTTAYDLANLMKNALANPIFNTIFSTSAKPWVSKTGSQVLVNQNKLFWSGYQGVDGGKVGYGNNSLANVITTATRENQRLICIVLETKQDSAFADSTQLLDYGFNNFHRGLLVSKDTLLKKLQSGDYDLSLASMENVYYTHPVGDSYIKNIEFNVNKDLKPPITRDLIVGVARYTLNDESTIDVNLYSTNEIQPPSKLLTIAKSRLLENKDVFYILILLCIIEVIIIIANISKYIKKKVYR